MKRLGRTSYLGDIVSRTRHGAQRWKAIAREALKRLRIVRGNVERLGSERDVLAIELWSALRGLQNIAGCLDSGGDLERVRLKVNEAQRRTNAALERCKVNGPAELETLDQVARAADTLALEIAEHLPPSKRSDMLVALLDALAALKRLRGGKL